MSDLADTITYQLTELRDELRRAQLTESARIAMTARVQVATIRVLIESSAEQEEALERLVLAFDHIHQAVKPVGPDPRNLRVRKAFEVARQAVDAVGAALTEAKPSDKAIEMGIASAPDLAP